MDMLDKARLGRLKAMEATGRGRQLAVSLMHPEFTTFITLRSETAQAA